MPIMDAGLTELLLYPPSPVTTPYVHPLPRSLLVSRASTLIRVKIALDLLPRRS